MTASPNSAPSPGPTEAPDPTESLLGELAFARRLARTLVHGDDADDLVQATLLRFLQRPRPLDRPRAFWSRALHNGRANLRRRADARRAVELEPGALAAEGDASLERLEAIAEVTRAVEALPAELRALVLERYAAGRSAAEIARTGGQSASTVRGQLARAREQLRERLEPRLGAPALTWLAGTPTAARRTGTPWIAWAAGSGPLKLAAAALVLGLLAWSGVRALRGGDPPPVAAGPPAPPTLELAEDDAPPGGGAPERAAPDTAANSTLAATEAPAAARVTGRVLQPDGAPAADLALELQPDSPGPRSTATTDANGRFTALVPADSRRLELRGLSNDHAYLAAARRLGQSGPHRLGDLVLRSGAGVRGRVVTELGAGLPDVRVSLHPPDAFERAPLPLLGPTRPAVVEGRTDAEGRFELHAFPPGSYRAWAWLEQPGAQATAPVDLRRGELLGDLLLRREATAYAAWRVTAVDASGRPVALKTAEVLGQAELFEPFAVDGSTVTWIGPEPHQWSLVAADGAHAFQGLPEFERDPAPDPGLWVESLHRATVELTALGTFELAATDAADRPLARFEVEQHSGPPFGARVEGTAGVATLRAAVRSYGLSVHHEGSSYSMGSFEAGDASPKRFRLPESDALGAQVVSGGRPVPDAEVAFWGAAPGPDSLTGWGTRPAPVRSGVPTRLTAAPLRRARTGPEGRLEWPDTLGRDGFFVGIDAPGRPTALFGPFGREACPEQFELLSPGRIEGRVRIGGEPAVGRELLLTRGGHDSAWAISDEAGRFTFDNVDPGDWCVLDATGLDLTQWDAWQDPRLARTLQVPPGAAVQVELDGAPLTLAPLAARLAFDGEPCAGWFFVVRPLDANGQVNEAEAIDGSLDANGELHLELPAGGRVRVMLGTAPGASVIFPSFVRDVDLGPEGARLELDVPTGRLRVAESDAPLDSCELEWIGPDGWRWLGTAPLGPAGGAELQGVPLGRIDVWGVDEERGNATPRTTLEVRAGATAVLELGP